MSLISQPGSDYQLAEVAVDAGNARDIMLLLVDVHAAMDHLYLDGTQPQITAPAEDYLRESASPYTLPALISAVGDVVTMLSHAIRHAVRPAIATYHTPLAAGDTGSEEGSRQDQISLADPGPGLE
jgi:hypothetical protein